MTKAYTTRVGAGPFPTEQTDEVGETLVKRGDEYGTTTGRRRRCGWFDAVLVRYAARLNGFTDLFLTKLDVLSGLSPLRVCVAYRFGRETYEEFPPHQSIFHRAEPVYEEMSGWQSSTQGLRDYGDLPTKAREYLDRPDVRLEEGLPFLRRPLALLAERPHDPGGRGGEHDREHHGEQAVAAPATRPGRVVQDRRPVHRATAHRLASQPNSKPTGSVSTTKNRA